MTAGVGAAKAFSEAQSAEERRVKAYRRAVEAGEQERRLHNLSYSDDDAIYGFYLELYNGASSVFWADVLSKPDVFILVGIEGEGIYLVPDVTQEYAGQPLLLKLFHKKIASGRRVIIYVMDDDTVMNTIWNNILSMRHEYRLDGLVTAIAGGPTCMTMLKADASVVGQIQLLDRPVTVDAQDFIAFVEFTVPGDNASPWAATGQLKDSGRTQAGKLQFAQLWTPAQEAVETARRAREAAEAEASNARKESVFWSIVGVFAVISLGVYFIGGSRASRQP